MNILSIQIKKVIKHNFANIIMIFFAVLSTQVQANKKGFISDDLTIFMHSGPGTNYRILGTITAGSEIEITGKASNEYTEIIDEKKRNTWVESKYVTRQPGLRFVVADLNGKLASASDYNTQLDAELNELKSSINSISNENDKLTSDLKKSNQELKQVQSKLKDQDTNIKKQWFFNGAIVLGVGLILGLILPKFFTRRRTSMDNWN